MNSYLAIAPKYLSGHKKKTRLTILSVVLAVTLVVGIFSMLDSLVKYEKAQVLKREGNYHILVHNPAQSEINSIKSRIDVENSGTLTDLGEGTINNIKCAFGSVDANFAVNLNFSLVKGRFPTKVNEILLEKWFMDKSAFKIEDSVTIALPNGKSGNYIISGIISDWGVTKAVAVPFAFLSREGSAGLTVEGSQYFILFKDGVNIRNAEKEIVEAFNISEDRIGYNEGLLALMLQTKNNRAINIYAIGVVLFGLVLITAVIMIYNTFNISVMDRVQQFGLLRCIGASKKQIKRLVRRESLIISVKAIPFGVLAGMLMSFAGSAILKYYNNDIYGDISIFNISALGIMAGLLTGIMTVYLASILPAKKAAKVSPVNAITGSSEIKISKKSKRGFLVKILRIETAIGVNNAINKKRTLILMSCSIAISIILYFGFSALVNPTFLGVSTTKLYTPDIYFSSNEGMSGDLYKKLSDIDGTKRIYGRMSTFINVNFDASRVSKEYLVRLGNLKIKSNRLLANPEKAWLVSYDEMQLIWAKDYLSRGTSDEYKLNEQMGVIAVNRIYRNDKLIKTTNFQIGDKVYIKTSTGTNEFTVLGVMDFAPYSPEELTFTTFITTEKLYGEVSKDTLYKTIDIQLENKNQEQTVSIIKELIDKTITFHDKRQFNAETDNAFMTVAVFIYGFLGVIMLIGLLNIINTMNTSIVSRMKYLGTMRAVGMSGKQLNKMVFAQALTYSLTGCITGCILGIFLQKKLLHILGAGWTFPIWQVILTLLICVLTAVCSVISPLKKIKNKGISETITSL